MGWVIRHMLACIACIQKLRSNRELAHAAATRLATLRLA
jgi:hypothetical protein